MYKETPPEENALEVDVHYAGLIKVRPAKLRCNITQKNYKSIFVGFSTHAVHIEVVEDYSSAAFIAAFHRFTARKGLFSYILGSRHNFYRSRLC